MSANLPATLSVPVFLLTVPILLLFAHWGRQIKKSGATEKHARVYWLLALGTVFMGIECLLLLNLAKADGQIVAWVFVWFCAHGLPALMVARNCLGLLRTLKQS
jgi:hypothetical protein